MGIRVAGSWFEELLALTAGVAEAKGGSQGAHKEAVLSPDGSRLYVVGRIMSAWRDVQGHWQGDEVPFGVQVVEVESDRLIATAESGASRIAITPNGARLLLDAWDEPAIEVLDTQGLQRVARLTEWDEVVIARRMDGRPIVLASRIARSRTELAVLDPQSFEAIRRWTSNLILSWVAAS